MCSHLETQYSPKDVMCILLCFIYGEKQQNIAWCAYRVEGHSFLWCINFLAKDNTLPWFSLENGITSKVSVWKKIPLLTMLDVIIAVCYLGVATEFQKLFFFLICSHMWNIEAKHSLSCIKNPLTDLLIAEMRPKCSHATQKIDREGSHF